MKYIEMLEVCEQNRDQDGFCRCCNGCSGPSPSNLAADHPAPSGIVIYRGGCHGSCRFEIEDDGIDMPPAQVKQAEPYPAGSLAALLKDELVAANRFSWDSDERWPTYRDQDGHYIEHTTGRKYDLHNVNIDGMLYILEIDADDYEQAGVYATKRLARLEDKR